MQQRFSGPLVESGRAPPPPCGGSRVVVVGGMRHSGTTLMQHQLLEGAGVLQRGKLNLSKGRVYRVKESWPPPWPAGSTAADVARVACSERWRIYKRPTNTPMDVEGLLALRRSYPLMRVVFMRRDPLSRAWSVMQRFEPTLTRGHHGGGQHGGGQHGGSSNSSLSSLKSVLDVRRALSPWCAVHAAWDRRPRHPAAAALEWTVDLAQFQVRGHTLPTRMHVAMCLRDRFR